jgi:hypothetical protein
MVTIDWKCIIRGRMSKGGLGLRHFCNLVVSTKLFDSLQVWRRSRRRKIPDIFVDVEIKVHLVACQPPRQLTARAGRSTVSAFGNLGPPQGKDSKLLYPALRFIPYFQIEVPLRKIIGSCCMRQYSRIRNLHRL